MRKCLVCGLALVAMLATVGIASAASIPGLAGSYYYFGSNPAPSTYIPTLASDLNGTTPNATFSIADPNTINWNGGDSSVVAAFTNGQVPVTNTLNTSVFDMNGFVYNPTAAPVTVNFTLTSDDGSGVLVNGTPGQTGTGTLVVDNSGSHGSQTATGSYNFNPGYTPIEVTYFNQDFNGGQGGANFQYSDNGAPIAYVQNIPTTPVPEPATLTLVGMGCVSLFGYGLRRRKVVA